MARGPPVGSHLGPQHGVSSLPYSKLPAAVNTKRLFECQAPQEGASGRGGVYQRTRRTFHDATLGTCPARSNPGAAQCCSVHPTQPRRGTRPYQRLVCGSREPAVVVNPLVHGRGAVADPLQDVTHADDVGGLHVERPEEGRHLTKNILEAEDKGVLPSMERPRARETEAPGKAPSHASRKCTKGAFSSPCASAHDARPLSCLFKT